MPKTRTSSVDSQHYIFSYSIRSVDDLPPDFPIPASEKGFRAAVFLPRDDPDWFGRSKNPPRILVLGGDSILVLTHPKYGGSSFRIPLADLAFYETGHFLLLGWLRFITAQSEVQLPYNTRSERPVLEFLDALMDAYFPGEADCGNGETTEFGPPLDIKYRNYLHAALRQGELLRARWFSPPLERTRRRGPFRVRSEIAGDLVAFTNKRALWITDRWEGRYERYGGITRTGPLHGIEAVRCERTGDKGSLTISFGGTRSWCAPLQPERYEEAKAFTEIFGAYQACQHRIPMWG